MTQKEQEMQAIKNKFKDEIRRRKYSTQELEEIYDKSPEDIELTFKDVLEKLCKSLQYKGGLNWISAAFEEVIKEHYRNKDVNGIELCKKYTSNTKLGKIVIEYLQELIRKDIENDDFYNIWKLKQHWERENRIGKFTEGIENVLNENKFNKYRKLSNYSAFICHFTEKDKEATELRDFLEFCKINTFIDHINLGKRCGTTWNPNILKEIAKRPIFILMAINKDPTDMVEQEIDKHEKLPNNNLERLRLDVILKELDESIEKSLGIDNKKQYLKYYQDGEEKTFNDIISSIINYYGI